jgi:hypothetical protein
MFSGAFLFGFLWILVAFSATLPFFLFWLGVREMPVVATFAVLLLIGGQF